MLQSVRRAWPRPGPAFWARTSGAAGFCSGASLILFFGLARPFSGRPSPWMWLGPVNDLTGAVQAGTLIPVAVAVRQLMPDDPDVDRWTAVGIPAMAGATVLPVLLVVRVLPFPVQAPMVTVCIVVMYGWVVGVSRAARRSSVWPRQVSTMGTATGIGLAACFAAAALAWALPAGSAARYGAATAAGVAGAAAWLGFPAWTLLLGRVLRRTSDIPT